jgi:molybdopterin-guanine dinucleotide biosynthesis protein B
MTQGLRVVGIVGSSGSGKTTLIVRLIAALRARGLSVSTIKHTHHHAIELDTPGKDSHSHRVAGANEVIVASDTGWARLSAAAEPASLESLLGQLRPVDVVLVEGYKSAAWLRRLEVYRGAGEPLVASDPGIAAIAMPKTLPAPATLAHYAGRRLTLEDLDGLLAFVLEKP